MERTVTFKNGENQITFDDLDKDQEMYIEFDDGNHLYSMFITKENIMSLKEHIDYLADKLTVMEYDDQGYFYCPKCENKQMSSETNDDALCNKCGFDMEFHAFDAGF